MTISTNEQVQALRNALDQTLGEIADKTNTPILFHYTNFDGLCGILKKRNLWLTPQQYLNDPSEIHHGEKIMLDLFLERFNNDRNNKYYLQIERNTKKLIDERFLSFTCSYCIDGDYLPAWRYYGDGAGFSIGFKSEYFRKKEGSLFHPLDTMLLEVDYDKAPSKLKRLLSVADNTLANWIDNSETVKPVVFDCLMLFPMFKNSDYSDEKEWRQCLVKLNVPENEPYSITSIPKERIIIKPRDNSQLPPFLKDVKTHTMHVAGIDFEISDIECIYTGPRLDFLLAKAGVQKFLLDQGFCEHDIEYLSTIIKPSTKAFA